MEVLSGSKSMEVLSGGSQNYSIIFTHDYDNVQ